MVKFSRNEEEKFSKFEHNVVSLEYVITLNFPQNNGKSFIYTRNNNGPIMDPCGNPLFI